MPPVSPAADRLHISADFFPLAFVSRQENPTNKFYNPQLAGGWYRAAQLEWLGLWRSLFSSTNPLSQLLKLQAAALGILGVPSLWGTMLPACPFNFHLQPAANDCAMTAEEEISLSITWHSEHYFTKGGD